MKRYLYIGAIIIIIVLSFFQKKPEPIPNGETRTMCVKTGEEGPCPIEPQIPDSIEEEIEEIEELWRDEK